MLADFATWLNHTQMNVAPNLPQPLLSQRSGSGCGAGSCHQGHPPHPPASFQILLDQTTAIRNNTLAEKPCPQPPRDTLKEPSGLLCREAAMDAGPALLGNSMWGRADSLARLCQLMDLVHETIFVSPAAAWSCLLLSTTHLCQPWHSTEQAPSCLQDGGPRLFLSAVWTLGKGGRHPFCFILGKKINQEIIS